MYIYIYTLYAYRTQTDTENQSSDASRYFSSRPGAAEANGVSAGWNPKPEMDTVMISSSSTNDICKKY